MEGTMAYLGITDTPEDSVGSEWNNEEGALAQKKRVRKSPGP
jgi:hypothetical protein